MSQDAAYAAFMAGDLSGAEKIAKALPHGAEAPDTALLLARIQIAAEHFDEAEATLAPFTQTGAHVKALRMLASLQYRRTAFDACETTLERLIGLAPAQTPVEDFRRLAKLKSRAGQDSAARAVIRQAMDVYPANIELAALHAELLADNRETCAELERVLTAVAPSQMSQIVYLLKRITIHRAPLLRAANGLPEWGMSWEDTRRWSDPEGLARLGKVAIPAIQLPRPSVSDTLDAAWIAAAQNNWEGAQALLDHVRGGYRASVAEFAFFGAAFHAQLAEVDDETMGRSLAPVHTLLAANHRGRQVLFVASDLNYFRQFTLPFLQQLDALGIAADVQVHLLDGPATDWECAAAALRGFSNLGIGLTAEDSGAAARGFAEARHYYHAVRFIRFFQALKRSGKPLWLLDADVHALRDPYPILDRIKGFDLAIRTNPLAFEPSLKIMACCVGVAPTARGLAFARRTAAYIHLMKERGTWGWGVDQMALFSTYAYMESAGDAPNTLFLGSDAVCLNTETSGAFQFPSGINKYFSRDD